jgi:tetratricopeptide (TPR) repeat protein
MCRRFAFLATSAIACISASLLAFASSAYAQSAGSLNKLLFEAHPLPVAAASGIDADSVLPFVASAPEPRLTFIRPITQTTTPTLASRDADAVLIPYQTQLNAAETNAGPFAKTLFEPLLDLSDVYLRLGDYEQAEATLEKADYIDRINNGLASPTRQLIAEKLVSTHVASGDLQQAISQQQYLLSLSRQHYGPGSLAQIPLLTQLADWNRAIFERQIHGSNSIGFVFGGNSRTPTEKPRELALRNLDQANLQNYQAIQILVGNGAFDTPELMTLEEKLLQGIYLAGHRQGLQSNPYFYLNGRISVTGARISLPEFTYSTTSYVNGANALKRMSYYQRHSQTDTKRLLFTMLNLADWHLLFNNRQQATALYADAYNFARTQPDLVEFATLLNPPIPPQLPVFMPLPHSRASFGIPDAEPISFMGYIDVEFSRTRSGDIQDLHVLAKTANASPPIERRLRRLLTSAPFRPQLEQGKPITAAAVQLRYYFVDLAHQ